jgi:hypothetical protein
MQPVITWLNTNSNAVQAFGSVVAVFVSVGSLVVTIVLARLTGKYVALTNTIAAATKAQAEFNWTLQREAKQASSCVPVSPRAQTKGYCERSPEG